MSKNSIINFITLIFLCLGLTLHAQDFKRDIKQNLFVPKGQWIVGSNISYSQYSGNDYNFLVVEGLTTEGYKVKFSPVLAYAFKNNLAAGGRFGYDRRLTRLDKANIVINDETNFEVSDAYSLSHTFSGIAILRNYISIGSTKRFALFNETQLGISGSQSKLVNGKGSSLTGTYETAVDYSIAVSPGLVAFINNFVAVELNVGVLGFSYSNVKQTTDQVETGSRKGRSGSFRINLLAIGLGIAFYI